MLTLTVALEDAFEFIVHKAEVGTLYRVQEEEERE